MANTYELISSVTVGAGGASSIDFTSIPATFTDLLVKVSARGTTSNGGNPWQSFTYSFNGNTSNRSARYLYGAGSSGTGSASDATTMFATFGATSNDATANTFGSAEIYIPNYAGSNNKSSSADGVAENNGTVGGDALTANLWANTAAINQVTLSFSNFAQYSTAYLYGIKNS